MARALLKLKRLALAITQPPIVRMASWYIPRLARRPDLRSSGLEELVVTSFSELCANEPSEVPEVRAQQTVVDQFHRLYYNDPETWRKTSWLGVTTWKTPLDMWVYQEIVQELRPQLIVECGTAFGGSAYFLACICDLVGSGQIVTIDIATDPQRPVHPRITYLHGSSVDPQLAERVRAMAPADGHVLVILDSDHTEPHVTRELTAYAGMVTPGSYLIVEDTNVNNHPVFPAFGPGPMEAVDKFLQRNDDFIVDLAREKYHLTFNPRGFLLRVR